MNIPNVNKQREGEFSSFQTEQPLATSTDISQNPWLIRLHQQIEIRLSDFSLSNAQLAISMGMSERQFYRKVQEVTGETPNQYLKKLRMKKALVLLNSGKYKTAREIAYALGYKKDSYFSILFKKEYGISPLNMLRRLRIR